ncbi:MAG: helix-turn-helix domain-containing protein [Pseudonocardiaceae bacterium]
MSHGDQRPIDPALYERTDLRTALAAHRFGPVFDAVNAEAGLSYREIGRRTGTCESVIYEIRKGRTVENYDVLVRIAEGLGIPRHLMGLSYGTPDTYAESVTVADLEEAERMLRRHLLALGGVAMTGATVTKLGAVLAQLPGPSPARLPAQLSRVHVTQVQDLTQRLGEAGNRSVCAPDMLSGAAAWAAQLLDVPGAEPVRRALKVAVAELHIEAGWAAFDAGLCRRALYHFARSLELGTEARDAYLQALALGYAGLASIEYGHPNDGLKMKQAAQVAAWGIPSDDQRAVVVGESGRAAIEACQLVNSATALALLGEHTEAARAVARGRDLWTPTRADPFGDLDRPAAELEIQRGRLDVAEQLAAASLRRWEEGSPISRTLSGAVLATIHVKAGEPDGLRMAHNAITAVGRLSSARSRKRLEPLADALDTRPGAEARDLARTARQVATTRP